LALGESAWRLSVDKFGFTWLGHATFLFRTPGGKRVLLDPWVSTNPSTPESAKKIDQVDLMLVTHGHSDHTTDVLSIARATGTQVVAPFELSVLFQKKGLKNVIGMNPGGTLQIKGLAVTMVQADHSSSYDVDGDAIYAGVATGYMIKLEDGLTVYFAGDTAVFGDMKLIADIYHPSIAFLPIGDLYTMGPEQASAACDLLGVKQVVPMHYGTFPALTGTPARLRELVTPHGIEVLELKPGESSS
jgi:L-ascorbate metabolism protein UlaG (beta-lactamase superfamily)